MAKTERELLALDFEIEKDCYQRQHHCSEAAAAAVIRRRCPRYLELAEPVLLGEAEAGTVCHSELLAEMKSYAEEHDCSLAVALSEVTKRDPRLWDRQSEAVMERSKAETTVIPLGDY
jgi:hypothetical protein